MARPALSWALRTGLRRPKFAIMSSSSARLASSLSAAVLEDDKQQLYRCRLRFDPTGNNDDSSALELESFYQDTLPSGSSLGTVVAIHGSPGSHNDFKYITPVLVERGIRVVGVNYPGLGLSQDSTALLHNNVERNAYVQALIDGLDLRERLVFMGHSRGTENALKMSVINQERTVGTVMVNPTGLRIHKGIRPFAVIQGLKWLYESVPFLQPVLHYLLHKFYNFIGLRLNSGRVAMNSMKTMHSTALHNQRPFLERLNEHDHMRLLFCFAGQDFLIETEISREYAAKFKDRHHLVCKTNEEAEEAAMIEEMKRAYLDDNKRAVTIEFEKDGHFLQKHRARFIAEGITTILQAAAKDNNNSAK